MGWLSDFAKDNIVAIYFVYGQAFFSVGLVTALQSRALSNLRPISRLWLLGAFGLLHGLSEWAELAAQEGWLLADSGELLSLVLKVISFAFLLQFAAEFLGSLRQLPNWLRYLPPALLLGWIVTVLTLPVEGGLFGKQWLTTADVTMRYVLATPGVLVSAYAFWAAAGYWGGPEQGKELTSYFRGAAIALVAYALFSGLTVPYAPFFPASIVNTESFKSTFGIPVVILRALCALAIGGFLAEAFIVEVSRAQSRSVDLLRQMDQMREEFISVVAHDLRTPLAVIAGYTDALRSISAANRTTLEQRALEGIRSSTRQLDRMVTDLLDASRIDAKRLTLAKEEVDLPKFLADVLDRNTKITEGHEVRSQIAADLPRIWADPGRIEQILTNLLSNAAKYSFPQTSIILAVEKGRDEVAFSVTNQGPGIAPDERERLFSRFHRTKEAHDRKVPGLGLGLHITKGLVEAHGGRIWLASSPVIGGGSVTFRFTLPIKTI